MILRLGLGVLWLLHFLPMPWLARLAWLLGELAWIAVPERRHVTLTNLNLCFPTWSEEQRRRVAHAHFHAFMGSALSLGVSWFASLPRLRRIVQLEQVEVLERALADGPVILMTPHFMGIETVGPILAVDYPVLSINAQQKNPTLEALTRARRLRWNRGLIFTRQDSLRKVLRALKPGWALYYLPDQDLGARDSVFVPFFGIPTATVPALAGMARLAHAQVLGCVVEQNLRQGHIRVRFEPPWLDFPSSDPLADTRRMNEFIEREVRRQPANYLWTHKRFKTRPPGQPSLY